MELIIGSEGKGSYGKPLVEYLLHLIYPDRPIIWENSYRCDLIVRSHFLNFEPEWVDSSYKIPYLLWSGESYPVYFKRNVDCIGISSFYTTHHYYCPFMWFNLKLKGYNRMYTNIDRPYNVAYCNSNSVTIRENMFNSLVEVFNNQGVHALGRNFGKYPETKNKVEGPWHNNDLIKNYSQYNFVISMENAKRGGYITEKIMNAYYAGAIPIYWGDSVVNEYFNPDSFINVNNFVSIEECSKYIYNLSPEKIKWMQQQPIFKEPIDPKILITDDNLYYIYMAKKLASLINK
jgi:hypothetical protein